MRENNGLGSARERQCKGYAALPYKPALTKSRIHSSSPRTQARSGSRLIVSLYLCQRRVPSMSKPLSSRKRESWREHPTIYSAFLAGRTPDNVIRADPIHARGVGAPWHPTGFGLGSRFLDPFVALLFWHPRLFTPPVANFARPVASRASRGPSNAPSPRRRSSSSGGRCVARVRRSRVPPANAGSPARPPR
jgi:hypothetical protein